MKSVKLNQKKAIITFRRDFCLIAIWSSLITIFPFSIKSVSAEQIAETKIAFRNSKSPSQLSQLPETTANNPPLQPISLESPALLAQGSNENLTRVTQIQINQTADGLELILETPSGKRLIPLISPDGKNLVIDIPDAILGFAIRNGVREVNPAPGISSLSVTLVDDNSIRVTITGTEQTPTAEVVAGQENLVLSVTPEKAIAEQKQPDEEIEVIATGQIIDEDSYYVPNAGVTRTNTSIIDTPGTVQVVPRQVFEDQRSIELRDALSRNAVGVVTNGAPRSNFNNVLIRGFDASSNFLRNGIPESYFILTPPRDLNNVEQLEVLSGPASVVGGQISPGGIINIVTKQPLSSPLYEISASYGSFNSAEGSLDFSAPLNDSKTVSYRLNAAIYHSDTVIDVDDVDIERVSVAPVLSWEISEQTQINFEGLYFNNRTPQRVGLPAAGTVLDNPNGDVPRDQFVGEPNFDKNDRILIQIGYDLKHEFSDDWSLTHAFRYSNFQSDQEEAFVNALQDDFRTLERSGDLFSDNINNYQVTAYVTGEFETGAVNHVLLAGVDYVFEEDSYEFNFFEAENIDLFDPEYTGGVGEAFDDSFGEGRDTADGVGLYLQDQIKMFDDRLILVLGGRVDFVGSSSDLFDDSTAEDSQDDTAFSPNVGILYKLTNNLSLYGSFSRSFEQVRGLNADAETFDPSRGTQYEVGFKADWLDKRLLTTLALYDLTLTNVLTEDPDNPGFDIQTGEQNSKGIELQTKGEILPGWNITASYAFTDTEITEDNLFAVGNSFANVPENVANLWTTYTISRGNLAGLGFGLGLFYVGEREGDLDNSFQLDDYLRTDAAIYYRKERLNLALNFKNILDVDYIESADDNLRVNTADPFAVFFSASYKF